MLKGLMNFVEDILGCLFLKYDFYKAIGFAFNIDLNPLNLWCSRGSSLIQLGLSFVS